jgi:hypothetical protein
MNSLSRKQILLALLVVSVLMSLIALFSYVYRTGYISIENTSDVELIIESGETVIKETDIGPSYKKRLPSGDYRVTVKSSSGTYFSNINVPGFLNTISVSPKYSEQNFREIVAYNPLGGCSLNINDVIYSYICQGYATSVTKHHPPKGSTPPYTEDINLTDAFVGSVSFNNSVLALVASPSEYRSSYSFATIGADFEYSTVSEAPWLTGDNYKISNYNEGFIVYNPDLTDVKYFKDPNTKPDDIDLKDMTEGFLEELEINSKYNNYGVVVWQNATDKKNEVHLHDETDKIKTRIVSRASDGTLSERHVDYFVVDAFICADTSLCTISVDGLKSYEINNDNLDLKYSIDEAQFFDTMGDKTIIVNSDGAIIYNAKENFGYLSVDFDENHKPCGVSRVSQESYNLCLIDGNAKRLVLNVSLAKKYVVDIENKIYELSQDDNLVNVTNYKNDIFIATDNGNLNYNPQTQSYGYNQNYIKTVTEDVKEKARSIGIPSSYNFINPAIQ